MILQISPFHDNNPETASPGMFPLLKIVGIGLLTIALAMVLIQQTDLWQISRDLDPVQISKGDQHSYTFALDAFAPSNFIWTLPSDSITHPRSSNLQMFRDGVQFGVAHSLHIDIANIGDGRYSHWNDTLFFSTPSNSDPRTDGHSYSIVATYTFPQWLLQGMVLAGLLTLAVSVGGTNNRRHTAGIGAADSVFVFALLGLAALQSWLLLTANGHPTIVASTDGGNISAWVAGRIYPERFATDFLLSDPSNTSFYKSVFLVAVDFLGRLNNDIGRAYLDLNFPIVSLQLLGYYLLGRLLTGSRLAGLILALLVNVPINVWGYNELFGTYYVPLTRTAYGAILPFIIMAFLRFGNRGRKVPILFALCGLSFYIHPVSAPAVSAGLLLGSLALRPAEEPFTRRIAYLFAGGLIFLAIALPFSLSFLSSFSGGLRTTPGTEPPQLTAALEAFRRSNGPMYYNAVLALQMLLSNLSKIWFVWFTGFVGLIALPFFDPEKARICRFLLLFLLGCMLASVGVCFLDQTITNYLGRPPFQLDLIRGLRFVLVPLLLGFVLVLAMLEGIVRRRFRPVAARLTLAIAAISLVYSWWSIYPNRLGSVLGMQQIPQWAQSEDSDTSAMMDYLRTKPVDGTILPIGDATVGLAVRYAGLQPIAFITNDVNALFYSGSNARAEWHGLYKLYQAVLEGGPEAGGALKQLVAKSGARYILLEIGGVAAPLEAQIQESAVVVRRTGKWTLWLINGG